MRRLEGVEDICGLHDSPFDCLNGSALVIVELTFSILLMAETEHEPVAAAAAHAEEEDGDDTKPSGEEEDTGGSFAPIVKLDAVTVTTGEENEEALIDLKAKLYRFDKDSNQWKERGVGQVRLLKHRETGKIRLLMRQSKTLKICANHTVLPTANLQEHQGSDKTWVWHASDFADGELKEELFCIRFASAEHAQSFKSAYEDAQKAMADKPAAAKDVDSAAELLESLKVKNKNEKNTEEEGK